MSVKGMSTKHTAALVATLLYLQGERDPATTQQVSDMLGANRRYGLRILRALEDVGAVVSNKHRTKGCTWIAQDIDVAGAKALAIGRRSDG